MDPIFRDRLDAGARLGQALSTATPRNGTPPLILGIPRGGVVVAAEVARVLRAPLDIVLAHKLGAPAQPELAVGAVVSDDPHPLLDADLIRLTGASVSYLEQETRLQHAEMARRLQLYRGNRPPPPIDGRVVVVVDDGIATGYTFRAALGSLRRQRTTQLIAAVPVAPREALAALEPFADAVICLATPEPFLAVGAWYAGFDQTTDEEVITLLHENWSREASATPQGWAHRAP